MSRFSGHSGSVHVWPCGERHEERANKELAFILVPESPGLLLATQGCKHPLEHVRCHRTEALL